MGVAGIGGAFVVQNGDRLASAVRGVRPLTARGALHVSAWIAGFVALGLLIRWLLPLPTWAAVLIALVTMCFVGLRWERRRGHGRSGAEAAL